MSDKKSNALLPEEEKRAAIYEEMSSALKKVADDFRKKEAIASKGNLTLRYDMGVKVKTVIEDEAEYGANAVKQLAAFLGRAETDLYDLRNVVTTYTKEEIIEFSEREMANGGHITMGHVMAIVRVKKSGDRKKLWDRVFAESLTVNQLATEVSAGYEKANKRSGGRKPSKPTSPVAGVAQILERTQELNNRFEGWDETVFSQLPDMSPDKVDKIVLEKAEKASEQLHKLEENLTQHVGKFDKGVEHLRKIVAAKAEEEKAAKAEHKKEEKQLEGKGKKVGKKADAKAQKSKRPAAA